MDNYNSSRKIGTTSYLSIFILLIFMLSGCRSKNDPPAENNEQKKAEKIRDDVLKSLHASGVTAQLYSSQIAFEIELLNDVSHTNQYLKGSKATAAANMGVYLSDLTYLIAFDQRDDARRYFDACLTLSEFVGMKKQFSEAIDFGFNDIIAADDDLEKSLDRIFKDADNTSAGEEFKKLHASALTGYYIEELYHLVSFLRSYKTVNPNSDEIFFASLRTFVNQKNELNNLVAYFDHIDLKPQGISFYQEILNVQAEYLALDESKLLREKDPSIILQDETLVEIFNSLTSVRTRIISL